MRGTGPGSLYSATDDSSVSGVPGAPVGGSTVTAIVAHARRPGRFAIVVDGVDAATIGLDGVERLGVRVGAPVSSAVRAALALEDRVIGLVDRGLRLLAGRGYATVALRRRLARDAVVRADVEVAIERLTAIGALDDAAYAHAVARSRLQGGARSVRRVTEELRRQGVDAAVADGAVDAVRDADGIDEWAGLAALAERRARALRALPPVVRRRRLYAYLVRRGYARADVERAIGAVLRVGAGSAEGDDEDDGVA